MTTLFDTEFSCCALTETAANAKQAKSKTFFIINNFLNINIKSFLVISPNYIFEKHTDRTAIQSASFPKFIL